MAAVGPLNDYVKFQVGRGRETAGGGGAGGMATEMAVGLAIAQQMMQQQGGLLSGGAASAAPGGTPEMLTPEHVAKTLGVATADVMSILEAGELKAKKIGSSWRIRRADLDAYLAG
jgi:excisionase family DNA binding protein